MFTNSYSDYTHERLLSQKAAKGFVESAQGLPVLTVVQTLHQFIRRPDGTFQHINRDEAIKVAAKLKSGVNKAIYKSAYLKKKKQLTIACTLETGQSGKNFHLNFAIVVPAGRTLLDVQDAFLAKASELRWARERRCSFDSAWDTEGWVSYITKEHDSLILEASNFTFL